MEYLPVETLLGLGCDVNVAVHLGAYADFSRPPRHLIEMIMRTIGIVARLNAEVSAPLADVVVAPDLRGFAARPGHGIRHRPIRWRVRRPGPGCCFHSRFELILSA